MMFAAGKNAQERNIQALATLPAGLAGAVLADDGAAAPIVSPSSWSLAVDLAPKPFTRFAKSSAFLYGPCAARSWIIACAFTGPMYIAFDALLDRQKRGAVASAAQPGQIRLRKALVFAAQRIRKGDIFDFPLRYQRFKRFKNWVWVMVDVNGKIFNGCARPVPRLKMPERSGWSKKYRFTFTISSTDTKSRICKPAA